MGFHLLIVDRTNAWGKGLFRPFSFQDLPDCTFVNSISSLGILVYFWEVKLTDRCRLVCLSQPQLMNKIWFLRPKALPDFSYLSTLLKFFVKIRSQQIRFSVIYPPYQSFIFVIYALVLHHASLKLGLGIHLEDSVNVEIGFNLLTTFAKNWGQDFCGPMWSSTNAAAAKWGNK